jgi:hypothetical protein
MKTIGLLPASGKATRLSGIPKFCLPISEDETLLEWHCRHLSEVCDEIRVSTRHEWLPIVRKLNLPNIVKVFEIAPSTMPDAISKLRAHNIEDLCIIGMPDTIISDATSSHYESLSSSKSNVALALWSCTDELKGKVGQVDLDQTGRFLDAKDKVAECTYPLMWGALSVRGVSIDSSLSNFTEQLSVWNKSNFQIESHVLVGKYMDLGSFEGIKAFYNLNNLKF